MSVVAINRRNKKVSDGILDISKRAFDAKQTDKEVIDATIGMMFDDNYSFHKYKIITEVEKELSSYDKFSYLKTDGGDDYHKAVLKWLFSGKEEEIKQLTNLSVMSTPGGSGALALIMANYLNPRDCVLLPDIMWTPYMQFVEERGGCHTTYNLYNDKGIFNLDSLKKKIEESILKQNRAIILLNDPCHNPSGFCMETSDYQNLKKMLEAYETKGDIVLIIDCAYIDFYKNKKDIVEQFKLLAELKNIVTIFAFSGSKTFSLYGLRVGAAVCMTQNVEELNYFKNGCEYSARATWSNISRLGVSLITKLVLNEEYQKKFSEELMLCRNELAKRAELFLDKAKEIGLQTSPYKAGFFICIPTKTPQLLAKKLIGKKAYVCPLEQEIRIALSAISFSEAAPLAMRIKLCLEEI